MYVGREYRGTQKTSEQLLHSSFLCPLTALLTMARIPHTIPKPTFRYAVTESR